MRDGTLAEETLSVLQQIAKTLARQDVARLALSPDEAARSLGISRDYMDEHISGELRWIRRGRRKFVAVSELEAWMERSGAFTLRDRKGR